jgi:hypothetical protein
VDSFKGNIMAAESGILGGVYLAILGIYTGITGHQYTRIGSLDKKINDKLDKARDHQEGTYVTKDTFEAHMDAIQQANLANAKFTAKATEDLSENMRELYTLIHTKADKS